MSMKIELGKEPKSPEERRNLLAQHDMAADEAALENINFIQKGVINFLISQKGFMPEDITADRTFCIELAGSSFCVKADLAVSFEGRTIMLIKCSVDSLESWERHMKAFCRVADSRQIPFAAVTDAETVRFINVSKAESAGLELKDMPSRDELVKMSAEHDNEPFPAGRAEKEKRILYAFDAITSCKDSADSKK
ncbi:MAG: type I restriction enzyme HsdR N-terminal domain-containing protein [Nitrospiraceae bacterium]|nr:type I restriction enzyme HsdR N-terminal domain-containing protein [Nitrospiraceae bacterium]